MLNRRQIVLGLPLFFVGCYRDASPTQPASSGLPQQRIVDRSANAIQRMRESGQFPALEDLLTQAKGVMIFPRVIKASLILGGGGGNGVFVARRSDGAWSPPAFYSLGGGSAGFQLGYQEVTVVLFLMNKAAVTSAIDHAITLGTDVSVAAGTLGRSGKGKARTSASDVNVLVDVGGLYAGVSLDGTVVGAREGFNQEYYGPEAHAANILLDEAFQSTRASALVDVLRPR
jgi:lipid-binding SYLF domain-containing protein